MKKNIIIILLVLSIMLYFFSTFLFSEATKLYDKYHVINMYQENNNNIYSTIKFYSEPTPEWKDMESVYSILMFINFCFKYFSPVLLCISISLYLINFKKAHPKN